MLCTVTLQAFESEASGYCTHLNPPSLPESADTLCPLTAMPHTQSSSAAAVPAHFLTPGATTRVTSLSGLRRRHAANTLVMPSTPDAALTTRTRAYSEPAFVQDYRPVPDHLL